ncbi:MAG: hypothetical protein ACYTHJ_08960 [Planctomycetota bacterium]
MSAQYKKSLTWVAGLAVILGISGCGKKADEKKPMEEVRTEAKTMDTDELRDMAVAYKEAIEAKKEDVNELLQKIKDIPITEAIGKEAEALKSDVAEINKSLSALTERFRVYFDQLKSKSGDISGLDI